MRMAPRNEQTQALPLCLRDTHLPVTFAPWAGKFGTLRSGFSEHFRLFFKHFHSSKNYKTIFAKSYFS